MTDRQAGAAHRWSAALASWDLPDTILAQAPESPWAFPPRAFAERTLSALAGRLTPTHRRSAEVLEDGGVVLDVGAGTGAASLPLCPPAGRVVAVDESPRLLEEMVRLAADRVVVERVVGRWPDVAGQVARADVAVCANVVYNVPDLDAFVRALDQAARQRVVLELTAVHPQSSLSWLWQHFWGVERPIAPVATDALAVVTETLGVEAANETWWRPPPGPRDAESVAWTRRRLCLPASADAELAELLAGPEEPVEMVTAWWTP
ncbi:MAG: class I SAM-dependent methyltransferase [Mycobacteriales bacterium]